MNCESTEDSVGQKNHGNLDYPTGDINRVVAAPELMDTSSLWIPSPTAWMIPKTTSKILHLDQRRSDRIRLRDESGRCLRGAYSVPTLSLEVQDDNMHVLIFLLTE